MSGISARFQISFCEEVAVFTSMNISLKIIVGLFNTPSIPNYMSFWLL
jgi:hypothetical protein